MPLPLRERCGSAECDCDLGIGGVVQLSYEFLGRDVAVGWHPQFVVTCTNVCETLLFSSVSATTLSASATARM